MKKLFSRHLIFTMIFIFMMSTNALATTVSVGADGTANFTNAQFYVLGSSNVTTYNTSSGTTVSGAIYPGDLCKVLDATGTYWKVSYPTSKGAKIAYVNKANILSSTSYSKRISISANETVYTKSDMSTRFGSVYTTDTIYMLSPISNGKAQIIYNVSGGYKIGWIYTTTTTKDIFEKERIKFPNGKYWNHPFGGNNPDGYSSTPSSHSGHNYYGTCGCNSYDGAIQCYGFALKVGADLYGKSPRQWTRSTSKSDVYNLRPGDYIRFKNDRHSAIVTGRDSNYIYVVECNVDGRNGISWNGKYSISTVYSTLTEIRKHP
ncbi:hypothetical protein [Clostridium cibarium]|uniref:Bacterial SH3 domain protein n=1 Tax=Clostridium cibarium TaxID=2762247 RepID=A0ABR8PSU5_9CLOT|nr:hypothetical protein [Clostridium cibarium]MBD7911246.1 hypothetical protein [Clostridium cibarium]